MMSLRCLVPLLLSVGQCAAGSDHADMVLDNLYVDRYRDKGQFSYGYVIRPDEDQTNDSGAAERLTFAVRHLREDDGSQNWGYVMGKSVAPNQNAHKSQSPTTAAAHSSVPESAPASGGITASPIHELGASDSALAASRKSTTFTSPTTFPAHQAALPEYATHPSTIQPGHGGHRYHVLNHHGLTKVYVRRPGETLESIGTDVPVVFESRPAGIVVDDLTIIPADDYPLVNDWTARPSPAPLHGATDPLLYDISNGQLPQELGLTLEGSENIDRVVAFDDQLQQPQQARRFLPQHNSHNNVYNGFAGLNTGRGHPTVHFSPTQNVQPLVQQKDHVQDPNIAHHATTHGLAGFGAGSFIGPYFSQQPGLSSRTVHGDPSSYRIVSYGTPDVSQSRRYGDFLTHQGDQVVQGPPPHHLIQNGRSFSGGHSQRSHNEPGQRQSDYAISTENDPVYALPPDDYSKSQSSADFGSDREDAGYQNERHGGAGRESSDVFGGRNDDVRPTGQGRLNTVTVSTMSFQDPLNGEKVLVRRRKVKQSSPASAAQAHMYEDDALAQGPVTDSPPRSHQSRALGAGRTTASHEAPVEPEYGGLAASFGETGPEGIDDAVIFSDEYATTLAPSYGQRTGGSFRRRPPKAIITSANQFQNVNSRVFHRRLPVRSEYDNGSKTTTRTVKEDTSSVQSQVRYRNGQGESNKWLPATTQAPLTTAEDTEYITERQPLPEARPLSPPPTRPYAIETKQPSIQSQYDTVSGDNLEDENYQTESSITKRPRPRLQRPRWLRNRGKVNNRKSSLYGHQTAPDIAHDVAASVQDTGGEPSDSPERSRGWKARLKDMLDHNEDENPEGHSRRQSFMDHIKSLRKSRISHARPRAEGPLEEGTDPPAQDNRNGKEAGEVHPVISALVASGPPENDIPKSLSSSHRLKHMPQPTVEIPSRTIQTRNRVSEQSSKNSEPSEGGRRSRLLLPRTDFPKRRDPSDTPSAHDFRQRLRHQKAVRPEDSDKSKTGDKQSRPGIVWPSQSVAGEEKEGNESAQKIVPVRRLRRPKTAGDHSSPLSDNTSPDQTHFYEPRDSEAVSGSFGSQEVREIGRPRHDALEGEEPRPSVRERLRSHNFRRPKIVIPHVRPLHEERRPKHRFWTHVLHPDFQPSEQRENSSEDYALKSSSNFPNRPGTAESTVPPVSLRPDDQDESESVTHQWHQSQASRWNTALPAETTETPFVGSRFSRWGRRLFTPPATRNPSYTTTSLPDTSLGRPEPEEGNVGEDSSRHSSQGRDLFRPSALFSSRWDTRKRLNPTANNEQLSSAAKSSERPRLGKGLLSRLRALMAEQGTRNGTSKEQEPSVNKKTSYSVDVSFSEAVSSTDAVPHYPNEASSSAVSHHKTKNTSHAAVHSSEGPVGFKSLFHRDGQSGSHWGRPEQDGRQSSPTFLHNNRNSQAHGLRRENSNENVWMEADQGSQAASYKVSGLNEHTTVAPVVIRSFGAHISRFGPTTTLAAPTEHASFAFAPQTSQYSSFQTTPPSIIEDYPSKNSHVSAAASDGIVRAPSQSLSVEELTRKLREQVFSKESNTVKPIFSEPITPALPAMSSTMPGIQLYSSVPTEISKGSPSGSGGTRTAASKSLSYLPEVGANSGSHSSNNWGASALPKRGDTSQEPDAPASSAQGVQRPDPSSYPASVSAGNSNADSTSNEEHARLGSFRDQLLQKLEQDETTTERPLSVEELTKRLRERVLSEEPSTAKPTFTEDVTSALPMTESAALGTRPQNLDNTAAVTHAPSIQENPVTISDESAWKLKAILDDDGSLQERQRTATTRAAAVDVTALPPTGDVGDHFQFDNEIQYASDAPAPGGVSASERPLVVVSGWNSESQNSVELELSQPEEQFLLDEEERLLAADNDGVRVGRLSTVGSAASATAVPALVMLVASLVSAAVF